MSYTRSSFQETPVDRLVLSYGQLAVRFLLSTAIDYVSLGLFRICLKWVFKGGLLMSCLFVHCSIFFRCYCLELFIVTRGRIWYDFIFVCWVWWLVYSAGRLICLETGLPALGRDGHPAAGLDVLVRSVRSIWFITWSKSTVIDFLSGHSVHC